MEEDKIGEGLGLREENYSLGLTHVKSDTLIQVLKGIYVISSMM